MAFRNLRGRKNNFYVLIALVFVAFVLLTINVKSERGASWFQSAAEWAVAPIQGFFAAAVAAVTETVDHYFNLVDVAEENDSLRHQVDRLIKENVRLKERIRLHERVQLLTSLPGFTEKTSLSATVIGRDASRWSKTITINRGSSDGVKNKDPVVTHAGVVGHVIQVAPNSAKVLLLVDTRSAVDALFQDSRISGVVVGGGETECTMKYVPVEEDVMVGSLVLTSGLGGIFPKGLVIGTVNQIKGKRQGLFKEVSILPSVDANRLEEVLVLLSG